MRASPAYLQLCRRHERLHRLRHAASMLAWDRSTMMPRGGAGARARAEAELQVLIHRQRSERDNGTLLARAGEEDLDDWQRANLREMRRDWLDASAVPEALCEARTIANAACEHGWRRQRPANDWTGFLAAFREVLRLAREEALHLAEARGCPPYDALMMRFEPGMTASRVEALFDPLAAALPSMLQRVDRPRPAKPDGPFPHAAQQALSLELMALLGFDFERGRLDESVHPFTGGAPEDVRITTRYDVSDFLPGVNSTIHETGHARYVQGLPAGWLGQPVGEPRSFGVHESQSLGLEMQLARSRQFCTLLAPLLRRHLGPRPAFEPDALHALMTRVEPGLIRVSADELSYPLHVIVRFRIERALIGGEIEADDLPAAWDEQMAALLGLDTRGNFRDGCLQDIHWSKGAFGYFPSYTLGAMIAAQCFAAIRREQPDLEARIGCGDFEPVFGWLGSRIWSQASRYQTDELITRATGSGLDSAHYLRHLEARYLTQD